MQDLQVDDDLTTVPTVEHTQYGITMKMIDLENNDTINGRMNAFLGSNEGGMGTTLIYIIGALLVIGCGILLIARRRMNAK